MKKNKKRGFKLPKYQYGGDTNQGLEASAGQMLPWLGYATQARDLGQSQLPRDEYGNIIGGGNQAGSEIMTADHTSMINAAKSGNYTALGLDSMGLGKFARMASDVSGNQNKTEGFWGKYNKFTGNTPDKQGFEKGGVYQSTHPLYNSLTIPRFPMGGNYPMGGNAQLEKQENTLNPDGSTTQFNLPSHENQSPEAGTMLDPGTLIFSDRLKPKGSKLTFAQLNKSNNTDKEDKTLDNTAANTLAKKTAQLMKDAKHRNSLKLFQEQEILKQSKADSYMKKLGGKMCYPDGDKGSATLKGL